MCHNPRCCQRPDPGTAPSQKYRGTLSLPCPRNPRATRGFFLMAVTCCTSGPPLGHLSDRLQECHSPSDYCTTTYGRCLTTTAKNTHSLPARLLVHCELVLNSVKAGVWCSDEDQRWTCGRAVDARLSAKWDPDVARGRPSDWGPHSPHTTGPAWPRVPATTILPHTTNQARTRKWQNFVFLHALYVITVRLRFRPARLMDGDNCPGINSFGEAIV